MLGEAATGVKALIVAEAVRLDVILMDLRMPEMDGVTAIAALRERGIAVRVLVLTTYDTDSDVLPAIEAATGYLLKDVPRDELSEPSGPRPVARRCSPRRWRRI